MKNPWEVRSQVYFASFSQQYTKGRLRFLSTTKTTTVNQRQFPRRVSATIFWSTPIATQLSLIVLQGLVMDISLGPKFKIPAGSLQVVTLLSTCSFSIVNDRLLYPFYQKLTGKFPTPLQRVGIGHVLNILSMALSAIVEAKRLKIVENVEIGKNLLPDSSFNSKLTSNQSCSIFFILLAGEAFHFLGNVALCYQDFPESMKNTAISYPSQ
ncbi:unnamed protein product [Brassica oleracea var. botrytis]|nr:unnamed protein product [Brassica napus]